MNIIKISKNKEVLPQEIAYLQAFSNYTEMNFCNGKKILLCKTLKTFQLDFAPYGFLRVNKKVLINQNLISELAADFSFIKLENDIKLIVSRRRRTYLKDNLSF